MFLLFDACVYVSVCVQACLCVFARLCVCVCGGFHLVLWVFYC